MMHRDFEDEVREFGDVVNTRQPASFKIRRKTDDDDVETQDARSTNVQVPLDQHIYNSFVIKDGEASKSFQELVAIYLLPAMQVIARGVDRAVLGQVHKFLAGPAGRVGRLLNLDETNSKDYLLEARKVLNDNKAPVTGRNLVLGSASETALLKNELFIAADQRGDGGTALEDARLGRILGFDTWMDQNVNDIAEGTSDAATGTVTNAAPIGASGSQAVGITIDGFVQPLQIGQIVSFGTGGSRHTYTMIESETSGADRVIWLDRPLETALADNDLAFPGPAGAMNLALHRDALALVTRPLALPNQSMGVMAAVASYNDIAMRVTMQYNSIKQGTVVNMDILAGVAVLDPDLAVVLQG